MQDKVSEAKARAKKAAHIKALTSKKASRNRTPSFVREEAVLRNEQPYSFAKGIYPEAKDHRPVVDAKERSVSAVKKRPGGQILSLPYILGALRRKENNSEKEETAADKVENAAVGTADYLAHKLPSVRIKPKREEKLYSEADEEEVYPDYFHVDADIKSANLNEQTPDLPIKDRKTAKQETKDKLNHPKGAIKTKDYVKRQAQSRSRENEMRTAAAKAYAIENRQIKALQMSVRGSRIKKLIKTAAKASGDMLLYAGAGLVVLLFPLFIVLAIGGMMYGSDEHSVGTEELSEEVHELSPYIFAYACEYELEDYIALIKAVMMQESGGRGEDPMQASECSFNTKYPKSPNSITDPEYSIDVGIQNLKECLELSGVKEPNDIENISLALQGYNFGTGYISWARTKYGGYSQLSAVEFSEEMAKQMGWESYGDPYYVQHVLRYYSVSEK